MIDLLVRLNEINVELEGLGEESWELVVRSKLLAERERIMEELNG